MSVVLTAFSGTVYWTMRHHLLGRIDQGLREELADVRYEVERANDATGLYRWLERRFARHEGFDFQITRPDGTKESIGEFGTADREIKRVKNGRVLLIPASENTAGHGTTANAKFYQRELGELLQSAPRLAP